MSDADARRWAEMAGREPTAAPPQPQSFQPPPMEAKGGKPRKEKRQKPPKAPSASRTRMPSDDVPLLDLGRETRSREELMQKGAEDLMAALSNSYGLLHAEVPDSSSPDDAQRKIEAQLARFESDPDGDLPDHPIYQGDTLVYHQLRRHYGLVQPGNTQGRLGAPLRRRDSIQPNFMSAQERRSRKY